MLLEIESGAAATFNLGQSDGAAGDDVFTKAGAHNGPNLYGLGSAYGMLFVSELQLLFVSDNTNNRVLVYETDAGGDMLDTTPDYVIGQQNFFSSDSTYSATTTPSPRGLAYDTVNNQLFVAQTRRVSVFNLSGGVTNGMAATAVIGQPDFTSSSAAVTATGISGINDIEFIESLGLLVVVDGTARRVLFYDGGNLPMTTGMAASYVIGQSSFTASASSLASTGLVDPRGVALGSSESLLFVSDDFGANRIMVYDLSGGISNGMAASYVLGQTGFGVGGAANTSSGLNRPSFGIEFDELYHTLYVTEFSGNRVKVFDLSGGISNGMAASYVLGQTNFTSATAATTQTGMSSPVALELVGADQMLVGDTANNRVLIFERPVASNGQSAVGVVGQYDNNLTTPHYTKGGVNNGPNRYGFNGPRDVLASPEDGWLFVSEETNARVLVYELNADGSLPDETPEYVLGQADFTSSGASVTATGMHTPRGLAYDAANDLLFVVQLNRVTVYDLSGGISNGMAASYVIGQPDFTTHTAGNTQTTLSAAIYGTYVPELQYLFVAESNRVKVFDLSGGISNGMAASYVLGQANFTSATAATTQTGMNLPTAVAYDAGSDLLFVAQYGANRVTVYDLSGGISNGMAASYVLGQANFTSATAATTQTGLYQLQDIAYDDESDTLFVSDGGYHRVMIFDLSGGISNGMAASYVLGQANFTSATAATTQTGFSSPRGLFFETEGDTLYVGDGSNNRVMAYDFSVDPVTISGLSAEPGETGAVVEWSTDGDATSQVEYGLTASYTASTTVTEGSQSAHSVTLSGLTSCTLYHYRAVSTVGGDVVTYSGDATFTTGGCPGGDPDPEPEPEPEPEEEEESDDEPRRRSGSRTRRAERRDAPSGSVAAGFAANSVSGDSVGGTTIGRDLFVGAEGQDVLALQMLLIALDSGPAARNLAGIGATGYFGQYTRAAVEEYQVINSIAPSVGYFGPKTRAHMIGFGLL